MYYKKMIVMAVAVGLLSSCEKSVSPDIDDEGGTQGRLFTLRLSGEYGYSTSDQPLTRTARTRAGGEGNTVFAVNVMSAASGTATPKRYAYGLFDDPTKMQLVLDPNQGYVVECTVVKDGEDAVYEQQGTYFEPFLRSDESDMALENRFIISTTTGFKTLTDATIATDAETIVGEPMTDRYYGKSAYTLVHNSTELTVNLKRAAYGIRLVVEPPLDGTAVITLPRRTVTVAVGDARHDSQAIYTFPDVATGSADGYEKDVELSLAWTRGSGTVVRDTKTLTVKRNTLTTVTLDFAASDYGHVTVNMEDTEMTTESDAWYQLVIIAHSGSGSATITSEEKVTVPDNRVTDTFYYYGTLTVTDETETHDLTLTRAVAMFRLVLTDDDLSDVTQMKFYYTGGSSTFSPKAGFGCVNSRQTVILDVPSSPNGGQEGGYIFEVYTFPHAESDELKLTVTALAQDGSTLGEKLFDPVPVTRNQITQYTGSFFGSSGGTTTSGSFRLTADGDWTATRKYSF